MDRALEILLALVVIGAALAFGGTEPLACSLAEIALFLGALLLVWRQTQRGKLSLYLPYGPVIFALLVVLQVVPLPLPLVARLSPSRILDSGLAGLSQGRGTWSTLSIYPHDTMSALGKFLAYLCAFWLAAHLFDSRKGKSILLRALIFLGCFEAGYGILQYLTGWQKIFGYTKKFDLDAATGTYINRNHFAGLLELTIPFVVASIFYSFQMWSDRRRAGADRRASRGGSSPGAQSIFYLFLLIILVVAVVFSRSRGGILATVSSIVFVSLLAQFKTTRKVWMVGFFVFLIGVAGYGLWIGLDPVLARFEELRGPGSIQMQGRVLIWKDALRLIRDNPLTGSGLGTFGIALRHYQTSFLTNFVDHAHNDYVEFASDTGLLGVALLFLPILYLTGRMVSSFLSDPRRYRRAVTLGCLGSTLALLLHSITDFNLQLPANALVFAVALGVGYKTACIERREEEPVVTRPAEVGRGQGATPGAFSGL